MRRLARIVALPVLALLTAFGGVGAASPVSARLDAAAAAYEGGRPADAIGVLEEIARESGVSASLYYDLGAVQLASGQIGPAILSFERARWLAPRDAGIAAALAAARSGAGLPAHEDPLWRRARSVASPDAWTLAAGATLLVACLSGSVLLVAGGGDRRRALRWVSGTSAAAFVVASMACSSLALEAGRAVVVAPQVTLRVAPFAGSDARAAVGAGEIVEIEAHHGEFVRVRAADGREGWAPAPDVAAVVPG